MADIRFNIPCVAEVVGVTYSLLAGNDGRHAMFFWKAKAIHEVKVKYSGVVPSALERGEPYHLYVVFIGAAKVIEVPSE